MKTLFTFILSVSVLLISCKKNELHQEARIPPTDEATKFAKEKYGDDVSFLLEGDLNADGKPDALAVVIKKQLSETEFWILRGGVIEKDKDGWKVTLDFGEKLTSTKGTLIEQVPAKFGYILSFKKEENPLKLNVSIADSGGKPVSDELTLKWNEKGNTYEAVFPGANDGTSP